MEYIIYMFPGLPKSQYVITFKIWSLFLLLCPPPDKALLVVSAMVIWSNPVLLLSATQPRDLRPHMK